MTMAFGLAETLLEGDPGRLVLRAGGDQWTSARLASAIDAGVGILRAHGLGRGDVVALRAERSAGSVVAALAVFGAGCVLAPMGGASAAGERVRQALRALAPRLVIADQPDDAAVAVPSAAMLPVDQFARARRPGSAPGGGHRPDRQVSAVDLAYILHTSGSTGSPKPVMVPHSALAHRLAWGQRLYPLGHRDVVLHWAEPTFDFSLWELLAPLCFGACAVIAGQDVMAEPARLAETIVSERVTCAHFVPSLLADFIASGRAGALRDLRYIFCGGETLTPALARTLREATRARIFNQYGPTEACVDCTAWELTDADIEGARIPIGRPGDGVAVRVLDDELHEAAAAAPGLLYVGGDGLAWGYRGSGAGTAQAFVPDPHGAVPGARLYRTGDRALVRADGVVEFLGRVDDQVKVRGVRTEFAEVEAALGRHPLVRQAAVTAATDEVHGTRIVAHVVAGPAPPAVADLRRHLAKWLNAAAIPGRFVFHSELPRLATGKVDRRRLERAAGEEPASCASPTATDPPATEQLATEHRLAAIWRELLKADAVGRDDDFFELGGHSLLAMRMLARTRAAFGIRLPASVIFDSPTLASLANAIDDAVAARRAGPPLGGGAARPGSPVG